jgi:hypothetical protein
MVEKFPLKTSVTCGKTNARKCGSRSYVHNHGHITIIAEKILCLLHRTITYGHMTVNQFFITRVSGGGSLILDKMPGGPCSLEKKYLFVCRVYSY